MKINHLSAILAFFAFQPIHAADIDFKVVNPADGAGLGGTLAVPAYQPKAVVVLATGSGQQDRDESAFGQRPFKVLSDALEAEGYAVLRMDDRGVGESGGYDAATYTVDTYVGDIGAALAKLDSIFPGLKKGVIGHSEGGTVAIKQAVSNPLCEFIVTLAGPAWSGDSIIMSQSRTLSTALTGKWDGEQTERDFLDIVKMPLPNLQKIPMLWGLFSKQLGDALKMPGVQEQLGAQVAIAASPYYYNLVTYDPSEDIRSIEIPWLALNGDKDTQVLPENLLTIAELNPSAHTVLLKNHNHLFQQTQTGLITDYENDGPSPSAETLRIIVDWLDNVVTTP